MRTIPRLATSRDADALGFVMSSGGIGSLLDLAYDEPGGGEGDFVGTCVTALLDVDVALTAPLEELLAPFADSRFFRDDDDDDDDDDDEEVDDDDVDDCDCTAFEIELLPDCVAVVATAGAAALVAPAAAAAAAAAAASIDGDTDDDDDDDDDGCGAATAEKPEDVTAPPFVLLPAD